MWSKLTSTNQLNVGNKIRFTIHEGDFQNETIYLVTRLIQIYLMAQIVEQNGHPVSQENQLMIPIRIADLVNYGFELWID
jgi:hypothetical protein